MPSSLRRSLRFLTVRTRFANMEQSRTSKLHTTLSMPIDSSLIYARYILKRKLQSHMLPPMYYLSRSVKIHTYRRKIRDWLTRKEIYISTYLFFIFLSILNSYQIYTKFSRDYSTIILFFVNILNISSSIFLSFKKRYIFWLAK